MKIPYTHILSLFQSFYLRHRSWKALLLVFALFSDFILANCGSVSEQFIRTTTPAPAPSISSSMPQSTKTQPGEQNPSTNEINSSEVVLVSLTRIENYSIVKKSESLYQISFRLPSFSYKDNRQDGYDLLEIEAGSPNQISGAPVLPLIEVSRLLLPDGGSIKAADTLLDKFEQIYGLNIPTVNVKPFSEGGISYTDLPGADRFMPSDADILSYQTVSQNEWQFLFSPFQYNPKTRETRLWQEAEVQIEYAVTTTIALGVLHTDPELTGPADKVLLRIPLWNLGVQPQTISVSLSLSDRNGNKVKTSTSSPFEVGAASENLLEVIWRSEFMPGAWNIVISFTDKAGQLLGAAATDLRVR